METTKDYKNYFETIFNEYVKDHGKFTIKELTEYANETKNYSRNFYNNSEFNYDDYWIVLEDNTPWFAIPKSKGIEKGIREIFALRKEKNDLLNNNFDWFTDRPINQYLDILSIYNYEDKFKTYHLDAQMFYDMLEDWMVNQLGEDKQQA